MGYSLEEAEGARRNGGFKFAEVRTWWVAGERSEVLAYPKKNKNKNKFKKGLRACHKGRVEFKLK